MLSYAEIHYRPHFVPSAIFRRRPEVITDVPCRIEPGRPLPVFILVKDAHRFPLVLDAVVIHIAYPDGIERIAKFPYGSQKIDSPLWWDSINIMPEHTGPAMVDIYLKCMMGKRKHIIRIDNYPGTSHAPFPVEVAESPLPGAEGWYHGDIHCHTVYTADQVEFGAPMEMTAFAAYCGGLDWVAATDHSYDLDNRIDSDAGPDPLLQKWWLMRNEAEELSDHLTIIPGEEISCRAGTGHTCHLLALNADTFIPGSGDSGDRGMGTRSEHSVSEAALACTGSGGLAIAAHPLEKIPVIERLLLKRCPWTRNDIETSGICGMQFYNGVRDRGFHDGKAAWIQILLGGKKIFAFGGSDSHGDMNRTRNIGMPLISIVETSGHILGRVRTVLHAESRSRDSIMAALAAGHAVVTDGPFTDLSVHNGSGVFIPGDTCGHGEITVRAANRSSKEFGPLRNCRLFGGLIRERREQALTPSATAGDTFESFNQYHLEPGTVRYVRAECETTGGAICFTNPVWIDA